MSTSQNLQLTLTPEDDTTTTFKAWRLSMNGESSNSNMKKIDSAYGDLSKQTAQLQSKLNSFGLVGYKTIGFTSDCTYRAYDSTNGGYNAFDSAISAASDGDTIVVMPGDYKGTSTLTIQKNVNFVGLGLPTVNFPITVECPANYSWETNEWTSKDTYSTSWTNIAFKNTVKAKNESAMDKHYSSVFNAKNCTFGSSDDSSSIEVTLGESELFDCCFENCTVACGSYVGYGGAGITFKNCAFSNAFFDEGSITNPTCYQCNFKYTKDPSKDSYSGTFINCDITSAVTFTMYEYQGYSLPKLQNCNLFGKNPFAYYSGSGTLFGGTSI